MTCHRHALDGRLNLTPGRPGAKQVLSNRVQSVGEQGERLRFAVEEETNDGHAAGLRPVLGGVLHRPIYDVSTDARRGAGLLQRGARLLRAHPSRGRGGRIQGPRDVFVGPRDRSGHGQEGQPARGGQVDDLHGSPGASAHAQPGQQGLHAAGGHRAERHRHRADRLPWRGSTPSNSTWSPTSRRCSRSK